MEFWAVEVKPSEKVCVDPGSGRYLHMSQAAIVAKGAYDRTNLFVRVNGHKVGLGTLQYKRCDQLSFDLVFEKEFKISHNSRTESVYFSGYLTPDENSEEIDDQSGFLRRSVTKPDVTEPCMPMLKPSTKPAVESPEKAVESLQHEEADAPVLATPKPPERKDQKDFPTNLARGVSNEHKANFRGKNEKEEKNLPIETQNKRIVPESGAVTRVDEKGESNSPMEAEVIVARKRKKEKKNKAVPESTIEASVHEKGEQSMPLDTEVLVERKKRTVPQATVETSVPDKKAKKDPSATNNSAQGVYGERLFKTGIEKKGKAKISEALRSDSSHLACKEEGENKEGQHALLLADADVESVKARMQPLTETSIKKDGEQKSEFTHSDTSLHPHSKQHACQSQRETDGISYAVWVELNETPVASSRAGKGENRDDESNQKLPVDTLFHHSKRHSRNRGGKGKISSIEVDKTDAKRHASEEVNEKPLFSSETDNDARPPAVTLVDKDDESNSMSHSSKRHGKNIEGRKRFSSTDVDKVNENPCGPVTENVDGKSPVPSLVKNGTDLPIVTSADKNNEKNTVSHHLKRQGKNKERKKRILPVEVDRVEENEGVPEIKPPLSFVMENDTKSPADPIAGSLKLKKG